MLKSYKCVIVGDGAVGKSCLLISYTSNSFPKNYVPTVFDNYTKTINFPDGSQGSLSLWDTAGQDDYDRLRPLCYTDVDIFLVCFSVVSLQSFENITNKWYPELSNHSPGVPIIIVGNKIDLLSDNVILDQNHNIEPITYNKGKQLADTLKVLGYFETSALTQQGLTELFKFVVDNLPKKSTTDPLPNLEIIKIRKRKGPTPPSLPKQEPSPFIEIETNHFAENFKRMVNNKYAADVLILANGKTFNAHRVILSCASKLFRSLFTQYEEQLERKKKGNQLPQQTEDEILHKLNDTPDQYLCPISRDIMLDPVIAEDGHSYERKPIQIWIDKQGTSPITRNKLSRNLIPNNSLKEEIIQFLYSRGLTPEAIIQDTLHKAFSSIETITKFGKEIIQIILSTSVTAEAFTLFLEFLYTGVISQPIDQINSLLRVGQIFDSDYLITYCQNILNGDEFLNPSIGTFLMDELGETAVRLFLNNKEYSDIKFQIDDVIICGHKAIISAQSTIIKKQFMAVNSVKISEVSLSSFMTFLTYLYSSHAPIEESDPIAILKVAHRFGISRLVTLCELYITKQIESAVSTDITNAKIDIIGILLLSQQFQAKQLEKFCLHFISSNYQPFKKRPEFKLLDGSNLQYIEEHKWPPDLYLMALEEYDLVLATIEGKISNTDFLAKLFESGLIDTERIPIFHTILNPVSEKFDWDNKVHGMLLCGAIGDALGSPFENMCPEERNKEFGEIRNYKSNIGLPSRNSQLTFWAIEQMIFDMGKFLGDHLATAFIENGDIISPDKAFHKFRICYVDQELPWWCCGKESAGNGALLRTIAHILPHLKTGSEQFWADVILSVIITHNDVLAITSSVAFSYLVRELLTMDSPPSPTWYVKTFCSVAEQIETSAEYETTILNEPFCGTLTQLISGYLPEFYEKGLSTREACASFKSTSYLMETIPSILYILMKHANNLEEAIVRAVNDTTDNGTIAACVGACVGALHGKQSIPPTWLSQLTGRTTREESDNSRIQKIIADTNLIWWD